MVGAGLPRARARVFILLVAAVLIGGAGQVPGAAARDNNQFDEALLEGLKFRSIGPYRGGRVTTVTGVVGAPFTYYMGATGGGVWKTTNAGNDWVNVSDEFFKTGSVGAIAVAQSDANVVYAGMGESPYRGVSSASGDGIYKSTDAGKTWSHIGLADTRQIARIEIHPDNPDLVYVAAQGSPWAATEERGLYRSKDGGANWERILYVDDTTGGIDIRIDQNNPRILYGAMWDNQRQPWEIRSGGPGSGIYKSTDGGDTWEELTEGLPDLMGKIAVAPSPADPERIWAMVEAKEKDGGLYRSDDAGETWKHINGNRRLHSRSWYYMHITADPQDENTVYIMNAGFFRSVDGGKSVETISVPHGDSHALWINPDHPKWMINGNDGGATISFDRGKSWSTVYNQPTAQFYRVNVDNQIPYRVYGGQQDNSTVSIASWSPDGGIGLRDFHAVGGCESAHVAFDPDNPRLVYAGCYLGLINEYDALTNRSRNIRAYPQLAFGVSARDRKYRFNWNAPIMVSMHNPSVVYHAGNILLRTEDRGITWTEASPDLTRDEEDKQGPGGRPITNEVTENYNTILTVTESPHTEGVIWTGSDDGLVFVTRDNGANWEQVTPKGIGEAMINSIDVSPHDPATAYIAVTRYKFNDHSPMIYRTTDFGKKWRKISGDLPDGAFVRVVREDTVRQGLLYAGTETGLHVSFDDGKRWQPLQNKMPVVPITDLKVHGDDLVISTQGRAFWILDDISPLRQLNDDVAGAASHLFAPEPAHQMSGGGGGFDGGGGQNPPAGAIIYYALASEPDLKDSEISLEILDGDGNRIRLLKTDAEKGAEGGGSGSSYNLPAKAGLNRAVWNFRRDNAIEIPGVFAFAGGEDQKIDGYKVAPGVYTVRLTVGDDSQDQSITVLADPRAELSDQAVAEHQAMLADLFGKINKLHRSVNNLYSVKEQVEKQIELAKGHAAETEIEETGKALAEKIDDWVHSVTSPDREYFQDVLNWRDRIDSDLQLLMGTLDGSEPPVTKGMKDRLADLTPIFDDAIAGHDGIISGDLKAFNDLFQAQSIPAITVPLETEED